MNVSPKGVFGRHNPQKTINADLTGKWQARE